MQPQFTSNVRQRPLQKSMFLPQTQQYVQRNNNVDYQYQDMMKRSSIQPDTSKPLNFQDNSKQNNFIENQKQQNFQFPNYSQTPQNQYNSNGQILNFSNGIRYKENTRMSQFEQQTIVQSQINQASSMSQSNLLPILHSPPQLALTQMPGTQVGPETVLQQLQQKVNQLTFMVESHDEVIKKYQMTSFQPQSQKDQLFFNQISQQLQTRLKQSIIPALISKQTKQIYEHIFDFKLQIKTIRQQISSINDNFKSQIATILNSNKSNSTVNSLQKILKTQQPSNEISSNGFSVQSRFVEVQKLMNEQNIELKTFLLAEIQKIKKQSRTHDSPTKMKSSTIKSTLSPIMFEYREIFSIKGSTQKPSLSRIGITSPNRREQKQITINSCTYFIDRQGYLLDNQNRYIIDHKGHQIKLDQKHLSLLKEHHVLT